MGYDVNEEKKRLAMEMLSVRQNLRKDLEVYKGVLYGLLIGVSTNSLIASIFNILETHMELYWYWIQWIVFFLSLVVIIFFSRGWIGNYFLFTDIMKYWDEKYPAERFQLNAFGESTSKHWDDFQEWRTNR